jgi:hypothetical protein
LTRANRGRHFLPFLAVPKHQATGMASVASSDTSTVYYRWVVNRQNSPALSSTNRNLRCRTVHETCRRTRTWRQLRKKWVFFCRYRPHLPAPSDTITPRVITSGASEIACERGQSPNPPQVIATHYTTSARTTTNKESSPALIGDTHSVMPGTKLGTMTFLIEDRHYGTKDVCAGLGSMTMW